MHVVEVASMGRAGVKLVSSTKKYDELHILLLGVAQLSSTSTTAASSIIIVKQKSPSALYSRICPMVERNIRNKRLLQYLFDNITREMNHTTKVFNRKFNALSVVYMTLFFPRGRYSHYYSNDTMDILP